jgi:hypothetical protein
LEQFQHAPVPDTVIDGHVICVVFQDRQNLDLPIVKFDGNKKK